MRFQQDLPRPLFSKSGCPMVFLLCFVHALLTATVSWGSTQGALRTEPSAVLPNLRDAANDTAFLSKPETFEQQNLTRTRAPNPEPSSGAGLAREAIDGLPERRMLAEETIQEGHSAQQGSDGVPPTVPVACSVAGVGAVGAAGYMWHLNRASRKREDPNDNESVKSSSILESDHTDTLLEDEDDDDILLDELSRHLTVASVEH